MELNNPQKLIGAMFIVVAVVVLMAINKITSDAGMPIITLIAGYIVGNGVGAKTGKEGGPIIASKDKENSE